MFDIFPMTSRQKTTTEARVLLISRKNTHLCQQKKNFQTLFMSAAKIFRSVIIIYGKYSPLFRVFTIIKAKCFFSAVPVSNPPHRMVLMRTYYIIESPPQATPPHFNSFCFLNFQTPTQTTLLAFLSIFMLFGAAHADESSEITLHNGDIRSDLSVVKNWTLICKQLGRWVVLVKWQNCAESYKKPVFSINSLNLSGPACGLDFSASADVPVDQHQESSEVNNVEYDLTEHLSELCETLCDNGLGVW